MISAPVSAATPGIPHDVFDTHNLPQHERFEIWRASVLPLFEPELEETSPDGFFARVDGFNLRRVFISLAEFSGQRYVRRNGHRADDGADHLLLQIYLTGGYVGYNGYRKVQIGPGDISLLDLGHTLESVADSSSTISVVIPREVMFSFVHPEHLSVGCVIPARSPVGRILGNHLTSVWRALHSASVGDDDPICHTLLGAVAGAFAVYRGGTHSECISDSTVLDAMCAYIERNLPTENLTPEQLCRRFACSRARLYRLFRPLGGVATYVRERRLKRCLRALCKQRTSRHTIHEIAAHWGFQSPSHFCRSFRRQFGMTPSEALERARTQGDASTMSQRCLSSPHPAFHDWIRQL